MKPLITYIILFSSFCSFLVAQNVPNGNFENWYNESNYQNPQSWDTPNSTTGSLNIFTVTRESNIVQNGNYSVKIQSKSIFGTPVPGLITLGDFNVNITTLQSSIIGGYPFTFKPDILKGYYQYEPVNNDQAFIGIILLKQNGNNWDTLGSGSFKPSGITLNWKLFTIPIQYSNTQEIPTHLNIIVLSSDKDYPQPNSTLYIDNLTFEYNNNIQSNSYSNEPIIKWENQMLNISNISYQTEIEIFDITGKSILKQTINTNSSLPLRTNNVYFIHIKTNNNVFTKKIITNL